MSFLMRYLVTLTPRSLALTSALSRRGRGKLCILLIALHFSVCAGEAIKAEKNHPLKNAKVGDWVEYKVTTVIGEQTTESTERMTITKNDGKTVAFAHEKKNARTKMSTETPLYLDVPCDPEDPRNPMNPVEVRNVKYDLLDKGSEKLKANEYEYACEWLKRGVVFETGTERSEYTVKAWKSKDVPLFGWVRREFEYARPVKTKIMYELKDCGRGK